MLVVGIFLLALAAGLGFAGVFPLLIPLHARATILSLVGVVGFPGLVMVTEADAPTSQSLASFAFGYLIIVLMSVVVRAILVRRWKENIQGLDESSLMARWYYWLPQVDLTKDLPKRDRNSE